MKPPFLIAETPRAGAYGHRFLIPPDLPQASRIASAYCHGASEQTQGPDFLAAARNIEQTLPNGAVRQGREILVLGGVDTPRLTETQKNQVLAILNHRLNDLELLVTQQIDWTSTGQATTVARPELKTWAIQDRLAFLQATDLEERFPVPQEDNKLKQQLLITGGAIAVVLVLLIWWLAS